jgi:nucleoside-diphosphate-sugar epimerase
MKRAFITGANGFLGLNLVEQLTAAGWQAVGLCQPGSELGFIQQFSVEIVEGDILDPASLDAAMPEGMDAIFHTAASTSVWSRRNTVQTRVNIEGTRNVVEACVRHRARRLVHTSTWNTYGLEHGEISEETPQTGGASWVNYTRTKFLAEEEVRNAIKAGLAAVILNPTHMMGRYDARNWGRIFLMVETGRLPGIPRTRGSFCHAEAVAKAHIAAVERGRIGDNYLLPGVEASFAEVIRIIGELTGRPVPRRTIPTPLLKLVAHVKAGIGGLLDREPALTPEGLELILNDARIDSHKAEQELGYRPAPLRAMLEDCFDWMKSAGLLSPRDQT